MQSDTFDLCRLKKAIKKIPHESIIIIASNKISAKHYWKEIKLHLQHLKIEKEPIIISNAKTWDGIPFSNSLVLKIGNWWENRNAADLIPHTRMAKIVLPITHIPLYVKGGD